MNADYKVIEVAVAWTSEGVICYNRVVVAVPPTHQVKTT